MSMHCTVLPSTPADDQYFQGFSARLFGHFIEGAREKAGLTVGRAAWLSEICPEAWTSMEAGDLLPTTREEFELIVAALDMEWPTMAEVVLLCSNAWGIH